MDSLAPSSRTISVEHVTIPSSNTFDAVRARLEQIVPPVDNEIWEAIRARDRKRAMRALEAAAPISIFDSREHGAMLAIITGAPRKAIQYDIGNPFTASKMTRHRLSAGLYAPIRVLLREDEGVVAFEYDRPASVFGQFGNADVDSIAGQLDSDLRSALEAAAA